MQRVFLSAALTLALILALFTVENAFDQPRVLGWFSADKRAEIQLGQHVYQANCAACHGVNLQGQPNWQSPGADGLIPAPRTMKPAILGIIQPTFCLPSRNTGSSRLQTSKGISQPCQRMKAF